MALASNPIPREPLYDTDPETGVSIEVFYADRTLETFGRGGAGWFWWSRRPRCAPDSAPAGPFATRYAAYRHAMTTRGSFSDDARQRIDAANIKRNGLLTFQGHARRFWNLSGTF